MKNMLATHRLIILIMWLVTTITVSTLLMMDVRSTGHFSTLRYVLQSIYVLVLLWHLSSSRPLVGELPELKILSRWKYGVWIPVLGLALLFALTILSDAGTSILLLMLMLATLIILVVWRKEILLRSMLQGLGLALVAYLAGLNMAENEFIGTTVLYLLPLFVMPMYVASGLLIKRTHLGGIRLLEGHYQEALKSLGWGVLLFVPLGLLNAASGSPAPGITWVTEIWMPVWLPWFSAIAEEVWFRLFLISLSFYLLRPALKTQPLLAIVIVVLFSGITFGLGHGRTIEKFLTTGLLYGVPMAAIFVRRDGEHAIGAHLVINMIPWFYAFLES
ncbi:MAG: hypothetical protein H8E26_12335 [FCB group bacterium]|nr:hypothetical protein [FCB group bacterium]MBL7028304.1 hypothetical protein [Candidatus Neomarinimicrobiota bacterium]MBL7121623.1 hypothetical protein [Candidatus Neomarinimicrobiota bacterium]